MDKVISFRMADEGSFYEGQVLRIVTADVGNGVKAVLSSTTTGMELAEFQEKYPKYPVDGQMGKTLVEEVSYMTDEQLARMGLARVGGQAKVARTDKEEEDLTPSFSYPVHEGYGWFKLSNGRKAKGKVEAKHRQKMLDAGTPEPEDTEE